MPFKCWSIDLLPTLPTTKNGYRHVLLMVDVFSKWVEVLPLKPKTSSEVWDIMFEEVFCRFGLPVELRCDRGTEFLGKVKEKCDEFNIQRVAIST